MEDLDLRQRIKGIRYVRILSVCLLCLLVSLLLILGIARQEKKTNGVEVLGGFVQSSDGGVSAAATEGFETWVLVQNPGESPVHVNLILNTDQGRMVLPALQNLEIPARGRKSFPLHDYVRTYHVSTLVQATDGEVVCERAMYWKDREGGHDSI
ncbi:MAG: hypothetical protein C4536_02565, partial [Actinobacteria bacterium]